ncbi:MAG: hypothetical protein KDB79_00670 [Acidobacteria bacterium]|nr:hypothetical protein [Acidobacteriota bacterium]
MTNSALGEFYFITGMMILILIICSVATYFFFKTYYKEMADREKERELKRKEKHEKAEIPKYL